MIGKSIDVSIIIPVYNAEQFLRECLDSVLAQDYSDYEVIIVNDGSTDGSRVIIDEYCRSDERFYCIDQNNMGVSCARNTGIDAAEGEYILFLDADDMLGADTLSDLMPIAMSNDLDMINMNWNRIPYNPQNPLRVQGIRKDAVIERSEFLRYYVANIMQLMFLRTFYKKRVINDNHIRFKTKYAEDILFNMHALLYCERFYFASKENYFYRKSMDGLIYTYFDSKTMIIERSKSAIEMLKLIGTAPLDTLSLSQLNDLKCEIMKFAGHRYESFQKRLLIGNITAFVLPAGEKIAFWGSGKRAVRYYNALKNHCLSGVVFVDNNPSMQNKDCCGYPIIVPTDMLKPEYAGYKSIITPKHALFEIFTQMKELGLVNSFFDLRLDVGQNEQYDMQCWAMDDLYEEVSRLGIKIDYPERARSAG